MQKLSKIIIGIDPGTLIMGYSIIRVQQHAIQLIQIDVLKLTSKQDNYQRLQLIHKKVVELLQQYGPDEFAIEAPFFGKNVQSMLKLGRAQGVAIAAAINCGVPVTEYSPKKVKQSITGNGNAAKEQVMKMLQQILAFTEDPKHYDATDALAVAVCHYFQQKTALPGGGEKVTGWKDFLAKNPGKVKVQK